MPSFQGDWGFVVWSVGGGGAPNFTADAAGLPEGLRVVDPIQLREFTELPLVWRNAVSDA
jgi:hypothetical protein